MKLPVDLASASVRNVLKEKWLKQTDHTRNWHYSNVMFMRLELVVDQLTQADIDVLLPGGGRAGLRAGHRYLIQHRLARAIRARHDRLDGAPARDVA